MAGARRANGMLVLLAAVVLGGCINAECDSSALEQAMSPDGALIAASFHWDCGATTKTAQLISIRSSRQRFDGGNDLDKVVFSTTWDGKLHPAWKDAHTLVIEHDAPEREIYIHATSLKSVKIEYVRKSPGQPR